MDDSVIGGALITMVCLSDRPDRGKSQPALRPCLPPRFSVEQRANKKRKKVRRIAPRPRNAPKPFDAGMRHFFVSVPKNADPEIDQALRDQVADTIEASVHPQHIEETPKPLAPDPEAVAASMQRLHEKLGIKSPDDERPPPARITAPGSNRSLRP